MADEPKSFYSELKQRKVIRVAAAYVVAAWVALQFLDLVFDNIGAPDWAMLAVMSVLAIGFPIALVLAWAFDITPDGVKATPARSRAFTALVVLVSLVALGWIGWYLVEGLPSTASPQRAVARDVARVDSIAVLPFENLSALEEDAYFADGLADTLLHKLSLLRSLKVIARNSSFQFRGTNKDAREIGEILGVASLLEGTVQRQGEKVRVIAQLIDTSDGSHIWSGTFDDTFENVFELQDRIAVAIMEQLQVSISDFDRRRVLQNGTRSVEAYDMLMRALQLPDDLDRKPFDPDSDAVLELIGRALAIDPGYAHAWAERAERFNKALLIGDNPARFDEYLTAARAAARKAIDADPGYAGGYDAMGAAYWREQNLAEARRYYLQALELEPANPVTLAGLGLVEIWTDPELAYKLFSRVRELDPQAEGVYRQMFYALTRAGRPQAAVQALVEGIERHPNDLMLLADLAAVHVDALGQPVEAARWGTRIVKTNPSSAIGPLVMTTAWAAAGDARRADAWLTQVERRFPDLPQGIERRAALDIVTERAGAARDKLERVPESPNFLLDRATAIAGACLVQGDSECLLAQAERIERRLGELEEMGAPNIAAERYEMCVAVLRNAAAEPANRDRAALAALAETSADWPHVAGIGLRYTRYLRAMVLSLAGSDGDAVADLHASLELDNDGFLADDIFGLPPDINPLLTRLAGTPGYRDWLQTFRGRRDRARDTLRDLEEAGEVAGTGSAAL